MVLYKICPIIWIKFISQKFLRQLTLPECLEGEHDVSDVKLCIKIEFDGDIFHPILCLPPGLETFFRVISTIKIVLSNSCNTL